VSIVQETKIFPIGSLIGLANSVGGKTAEQHLIKNLLTLDGIGSLEEKYVAVEKLLLLLEDMKMRTTN